MRITFQTMTKATAGAHPSRFQHTEPSGKYLNGLEISKIKEKIDNIGGKSSNTATSMPHPHNI